MKTCGIVLKGNEAIIVCLVGDASRYHLIASDTKKIPLMDAYDQKEVQIFQQKILDFLSLHGIDQVAIKERATKGKFAGGSVSFKMEALIQNCPVPVSIVHGLTIKAKLKTMQPLPEMKLNTYQKDAFDLAVFLLL
jgi:hypothetical protein